MMTASDPQTERLFAALPIQDAPAMARLHARLADEAQREGILDVAYRTLDTPVGTLLLAATEQGLVKVAYAVQDHDAVLRQLAEQHQPAHPERPGPPGRDRAGRSRSTSPAGGPGSTCRWTGGCRRDSGARC